MLPQTTIISVRKTHPWLEGTCSNSDQPVNIAIRRCLPIHLKRESAPMNVRSVPTVLRMCWVMSVQIAEAASYPGLSGRQITGKVTTFSARTRRAQPSNTGRSMPQLMRCSLPPSERSHLRSDDTCTYISVDICGNERERI